MPKFDLDAIAAEARAKFEPFEFTIGGETFTLPSPADLEWKHRQILMRSDEQGLKAVLGDEDYKRFVRTRPSDLAVTAMLKDYARYVGDAAGEASGSTPS